MVRNKFGSTKARQVTSPSITHGDEHVASVSVRESLTDRSRFRSSEDLFRFMRVSAATASLLKMQMLSIYGDSIFSCDFASDKSAIFAILDISVFAFVLKRVCLVFLLSIYIYSYSKIVQAYTSFYNFKNFTLRWMIYKNRSGCRECFRKLILLLLTVILFHFYRICEKRYRE